MPWMHGDYKNNHMNIKTKPYEKIMQVLSIVDRTGSLAAMIDLIKS